MKIAYSTITATDSDIELGLPERMNEKLSKISGKFVVLEDTLFQFEFSNQGTQIFYDGQLFHPKEYDLLFLGDTLSLYLNREFVRQGIPVVNPPDAYFFQEDKIKFLALMQQHGLPIPKSTTVATLSQVRLAIDLISPPYIVKYPRGEGGQGVCLAESGRSLLSVMESLWFNHPGQRFLIQEFVATGEPGEQSRDYRCTVIGDRIIPITRFSTKDFRANWSKGGRCAPATLTPEEEKLVRKCAEVSGLEIMGVDFLRGKDGNLYLTELNQAPGMIWEQEDIDAQHVDALITLFKSHST